MKNKGVGKVATSFKGLAAAVVFGFSYIDHIFSPLIWALLVLVILDILLNVHHEDKQFTKIGSAFATLGGTELFSQSNLFSIDVIHGLVAVMVLAYLQVVVPQVIVFIQKLKGLSSTSKVEMIAILQAENEALKQKAVSQDSQENKVEVIKK